MSWSPDLYIGELRPWPDSVHVVRGSSGEVRRYMPERKDAQEALERRIDELCAEVERGKAEFKKMDVWHSQELKAAMVENAKLRELVVTLWAYIQRPTTKQWTLKERMAILDDAFDCMRELGIEVPS